MNRFNIEATEKDVVKVLLKVADGSIKEPELTKWPEEKSIPNYSDRSRITHRNR